MNHEQDLAKAEGRLEVLYELLHAREREYKIAARRLEFAKDEVTSEEEYIKELKHFEEINKQLEAPTVKES